ncbi:toll/interleukin-1 receptor domain-containing protein [Metapseudomonas otitidis]|uniref:toll/interleukin-1 receptor domain-containing protein n=1 Tax=Metapseudomonas otitidis TaxID=319939 RepID=UPI00280C0465|nr:toll/interleukin-1 receptor domain-containing protein [Pseudomonas otitidis]
MAVFISYRHSDRDVALAINEKFRIKGIKTYIDVLDAESSSTDDITAVITDRIASCSHLLAVVSQDTAKSWWVPFEIGEATIIARRISSYKTGALQLPDYLQKWPVLTEFKHLDMFIDEYLRDSKYVVATESLGSVFDGSGRSSADLFHSKLKARISSKF